MIRTVKSQITVPQAAERYGIIIGRNGKAVCPFHNDHEPSLVMKERRYRCFGCGATGDVIDLTASLFGLRPGDAARKLAQDFEIHFTEESSKPQKPNKHTGERTKFRRQEIEKAFEIWKEQALEILSDYRRLLLHFREAYAPCIYQKDWHPLFCESLNRFDAVDDTMAMLLCGALEEQIYYYLNNKEEIDEIRRRMEKYRRENAG